MSKSTMVVVLALLLSISSALAETPCRRAPLVPERLVTMGSATSAVYADFNKDGTVDVAALRGSDELAVFLNRGGVLDPVYSKRIESSSIVFSGSLVAAVDQNNDGNLDLLLRWNISIWLALGRGDGTFEDTKMVQVVKLSGWRAADINGDGRLDFADFGGREVRTVLSQPDGTFRESESLTPDHAEFVIDRYAAGDFDGDGRVDLFSISTSTFGTGYVSVFWQNADHTFVRQSFSIQSEAQFSVVDFDGDGAMDLIGSDVDGKLVTLRLAGRQLANVTVDIEGMPKLAVAAGRRDLDSDGFDDVVFTSNWNVGVLWGSASGLAHSVHMYGLGGGAKLVDFNKDGFDDILSTNGTNGLSVLYGSASRELRSSRVYSAVFFPRFLDARDLNGDGAIDVVLTDANNPRVGILYGDSSGGFHLGPMHKAPGTDATPTQTAAGDFDGDGAVDLAMSRSFIDGKPAIVFGDGHGDFGPATLSLGDLTSFRSVPTGTSQAALIGLSGPNVQYATISSGRSLQLTPITASPSSLSSKVIPVDIDGDGDSDLVISEISQARIFRNTAEGWKETTPIATGTNSSFAAAGDVDGDGRFDLILATDSGQALTYLGAASNTFAWNKKVDNFSGSPGSLHLVDYDGDGKLDLLASASGFGASKLGLHRNVGGGAFAPAASASLASGYNPQSFMADLDHDGFLDTGIVTYSGIEVLRNDCAAPMMRIATLPATIREGDTLTLVVQVTPPDAQSIGGVIVREGSPIIAVYQPNRGNDYATAKFTLPRMKLGTHTYTVQYSDQYAGEFETTVTLTVLPKAPRRRAID